MEDLFDHFAFDAIDDAAVDVVGFVAGVAQAQVDQLFGEGVEIERYADRPRRAAGGDCGGEQVERQLIAGGHDDGPLDVVLQFANVAGPLVLLQGGQGPWIDVGHVAVVLFIVDVEEMSDQFRDILAAISQRRQVERHDVEPVVKVFAEAAGGGFGQEVAVAGGDDTGVDADGCRVADAFELAFLQGAEQLHLQVGRGGVDFVEEDAAGVGGFEAAGAVVDRAGERAADVAEELAFEQAFAERAAVDADERAVAALAEVVDGVGDEFLAGAGFAEQQDRRAAASHLAREARNFDHRTAGADDAR